MQKRISLKKTLVSLTLSCALVTSNTGAALARTPEASPKPAAKNIILMISDGCGYNQLDAASLYQYGKTGTQLYEHFPVKYGMSTYSVSAGSYDPNKAWTVFDYVRNSPTDSAAAATAMSTGVKTYDAAIGVGADKVALQHISQLAEEQGKATGVITSVEFSHATPAGFIAHNVSRNDYAGIANEMLRNSKTDVIMGAGNPWFDDNGQPKTTANNYKYVGGKDTWDGLVNGTLPVADADKDGQADPWSLIQTKEDFLKLMEGETPKRVLGVPQVYTTLQQARGGDGQAAPYAVELNQSVPSLAEMTKGAINVLDNDQDGFFLMVEGGAVDWASHANQNGRTIEEEIAFNKAVEAAIDWVNKNSNWGETMLIVTGDHETGYLTSQTGTFSNELLANNGSGNVPGMAFNSGEHTNSLIPFFAKGDAARLFRDYADETDPVRGRYLDNTEVAKAMFKAFGVEAPNK